MDKVSAMRFVYMFLDFVENHGIFDEFDAEQNKMVTSSGVKNLIEHARNIVPERVAYDEAAEMMRGLTPAERSFLIEEDEDNVVIDKRDYFAEEVARNKGARGIITQLAEAQSRGDLVEIRRLISLAGQLNEKIQTTT